MRWIATATKKLQEEAYTRLGKQLGLGSDPMTGYRCLTAGESLSVRHVIARLAPAPPKD